MATMTNEELARRAAALRARSPTPAATNGGTKRPMPFENVRWRSGKPPRVLNGEPVPFAIGMNKVLQDLAVPGQEETVLAEVRRWCGSKPYLAALMTDGALRYDADRKPVEPVSLEHQQIAAGLMVYRLAKPKP